MAVRVENATGMAKDTKVVDTISGEEIKHISSVNVKIEAGGFVRVEMELLCFETMAEGVPAYTLVDPKTGKSRLIKKIVFDDGTTLEA